MTRTTVRLALAALLAALPVSALRAEGTFSGNSALGTYLAARMAQDLRDTTAASALLKSALDRDPANAALLGQAFVSDLMTGNWPSAVSYARRAVAADPKNQFAHLVLGVDAFKSGRLGEADKHFSQPGATPIAIMARAWVSAARGDGKGGIALLGGIKDPNWVGFFRTYQTALMQDVTGDKSGAAKSYAEMFGKDPGTINVALGYAKHASAGGDNKLAGDILAKHIAAARAPHPLIAEADRAIKAGETLDLDTRTPADGLGSVFYGFSQAINGQGGVDVALIYAQFALQLRQNDQLALVQLAALYEQIRQYDDAIAVYDRLPATSPLQFDARVRKGLNLNALEKMPEAKAALDGIVAAKAPDAGVDPAARAALHAKVESLDGVALKAKDDRVAQLQTWLTELGLAPGKIDGKFSTNTESAVKRLQKDAKLKETGALGPQTRKALEERLADRLKAPAPAAITKDQTIDLYQTIGNMLRGRKEFAGAAEYYSKAIDLIGKPDKQHWDQYYSRAVCLERLGQWPKAEADFKVALDLNPDEPLILNYLGYSWVDRNDRVEEALKLIKRAVELKPEDGYYIDSLGWAYYRLGRFEEAVAQLERAVELKAEDPTINDHLGDAYWRAGRKFEAQYQWSIALASKPEAVDVPKIQAKLKDGMPPEVKVPAPAAAATPVKPVEPVKPEAAVKSKDAPKTP